jgi:hypothetical protein
MLKELGFQAIAYDWRPQHIASFEAELIALRDEGISLLAWWFPFEAGDTLARETLSLFAAYAVKPQLWVMQAIPDYPALIQEARANGLKWKWGEDNNIDLGRIPQEEHSEYVNEIWAAILRLDQQSVPRTITEQHARVTREAKRIADIAAMARPYGCHVGLYNHRGWLGNMENEVRVLARLAEDGVTDVGLIYNFDHCCCPTHNDANRFDLIWPLIKSHVWAVNVSGVHAGVDDCGVLLGRGLGEHDMIATIHRSDWRGPIGLLGKTGGDAAVTLAAARAAFEAIVADVDPTARLSNSHVLGQAPAATADGRVG